MDSASVSLNRIVREPWNSFLRLLEKLRIRFQAHTLEAACGRRRDGRPGTHKAIQDNPITQRQNRPHDLPQEVLRFQ